jgi:hypothetical protein
MRLHEDVDSSVLGAKTSPAFVKFHTFGVECWQHSFVWEIFSQLGPKKVKATKEGHLDGVCQTDLFNCCALTTLFSPLESCI